MIGRAVLIELACQGRGLREDNATEQEHNEGAAPPEAHLSCH